MYSKVLKCGCSQSALWQCSAEREPRQRALSKEGRRITSSPLPFALLVLLRGQHHYKAPSWHNRLASQHPARTLTMSDLLRFTELGVPDHDSPPDTAPDTAPGMAPDTAHTVVPYWHADRLPVGFPSTHPFQTSQSEEQAFQTRDEALALMRYDFGGWSIDDYERVPDYQLALDKSKEETPTLANGRTKTRRHEDYTILWISPLEVELIAALEMLDTRHSRLPQHTTDPNVYTLGEIAGHSVVIVGMPQTGNCSAATVMVHARWTFPNLRFCLLVGIGGGVPRVTDNGPIRLGDVVVSKPTGPYPGVVQYDHGKAQTGCFEPTGALPPPPAVLLSAAQAFAADQARSTTDALATNLSRIDTTIRGLRKYRYPGRAKDHLYRPNYPHRLAGRSCIESLCDPTQRIQIPRYPGDDSVVVHRGTIASGELVMRSGRLRDNLASQYDVLCFEMEAAGVLTDFPCMVIRGISDYSDSHKNDLWQGYAAATAAAYARALFSYIPINVYD